MQCRICDNKNENKVFQAREMMLGMGDEFTYFQCGQCQCLQIVEFFSDIDRFYPTEYYSLTALPYTTEKNPIRIWTKRWRDRYAVFGQGVIGRWLYNKYPSDIFRSLSLVPISKKWQILDVGSGSGRLLYSLKDIGFENLLGVDPYLEQDLAYENGVKVLKKSVFDLTGTWDFIMFHHVFEHLSNPRETLEQVSKLLKPAGICMLRIPTVPCYAWEKYGIYWVQLDAPRHFFIHSPESIKILAQKANLKIEKIVYDSTILQFWGSEQYLKGIQLFAANSYGVNPARSIFSESQIRSFEEQTQRLNQEGKGDQVAVVLRKF
ncbi:class I SAM-dependent methyltransferase [candidate division KSB1 bacterium]|nr:class I SAM-dependent methyltransferase [candidate division KSB1 bacterium]